MQVIHYDHSEKALKIEAVGKRKSPSKEVLEKVLCKTKFEIEHLSYIDRLGQFPNDLLLDGRESVGVIAVKPK